MRSIRYRLAAFFFAILLAAVAFVYLYVVPQLESRLRDERLSALAEVARRYSPELQRTLRDEPSPVVAARVSNVADRATVRVTLLNVGEGSLGLRTDVVADSAEDADASDLRFQVANEAARAGRPVTGTEPSDVGRLAQAARPLRVDGRVARVVVFSSPLTGVQATVVLIGRQVLAGGAIALVLGVLAGYLVAARLTRRVKRIEQAAERIAAGDFSRPVRDDGDDELGQLASAFDEMRGQLEQLDSARKRFIAVASHELRTPIFSLGGFVELLRDEEIDEETREQFLAQMAEQIERLRGLATDLLDLSKLEAGSLELHAEPVDVGALARTVAAEFTPALQRHDSSLELRLPEDELEAICDPDRVAQIMRILLDNALRHTAVGTDVVLSATREDDRVRLAVRDFGRGIRRSSLPRIWEPFFTADTGGSGLGLPIARELAERMQGQLDVESAPGRTIFTLAIPVVAAAPRSVAA